MSKPRTILFLLILSATAWTGWTGCAIGPDFIRSNPNTPSRWQTKLNAEMVTSSRDLSKWWHEFKDPLLTRMIETSLTSSTDMRLAISRIRESRANRGMVATGLWPTLDANGSFTRSHSPASGASSSSSSSSSSGPSLKSASNQFKAGLETSWEIDVWGRLRRNVEASDAELDVSIEDARAVQVSLVADIGTAYANYRGFQKQLEIAKRSLETQTKTAEIIGKRYRAGYSNALDSSNADAQVAQTNSQIPVLEAALANASNSIALLIGRDSGPIIQELARNEDGLPMIPPEVPIGLPSDLLQRRPDIRRSDAQIHAATARIGVAKGEYFPKFSLTGSAGYSNSDRKLIGHPRAMYWSFGPSVSLPLFDIARIRWNVEAQESLQEHSLISYEKTLQTALGEVETALIAYATEKERQKYIAIAVEKNRHSLELANKLYRVGKTDFLTLGSAQSALQSSETNLAASERDLVIDLISLYKALGGGWEP